MHLSALYVSLRTQAIALAVLVALLSGAVVGSVSIDRARAAVRADILHQNLAAAELAAALVSSYMADAQDAARELAARPQVRLAASRDELGSLEPDLQVWLQAHPRMQFVGLIDLDGVRRANGMAEVGVSDGREAIGRDWFEAVLATGQPTLGKPGRSVMTGRPRVPFGVPVQDPAGNLRAVLIASISLEEVSTTLNHAQVGSNARTGLVDLENGLILSHADPRRILEPNSGRNAALAHMQARERGAQESVNSLGERTLAAFSPVDGLPWAILIQQPSIEAFRPVDEMVNSLVGLILAAVALAGVVGGLLALSLSRPLRQLRSSAEAMAAGDLSQRSGMTRRDEVGELGRAFDHMAEQLQHTLDALQQGEDRFRGLVGVSFDGVLIH
ncbi:MAG TPA: cache domain-containing protein, partial [Chloroflexota bacterium]